MIQPSVMNELSSITMKLSPEVLIQELNGESVLLDLRNGEYFGINPIGSQIMHSVSLGIDLVDIAKSLSESFKLERGMAVADVLSFVRRLGEIGLVEIVEDSE